VLPAVIGTPALAAPMAQLAFMRGVWAGPAAGSDRSGPYKVTQTERIGPMLGGDVMVMEGRGYRDDNTTGFNAFAAISGTRRRRSTRFDRTRRATRARSTSRSPTTATCGRCRPDRMR
jgi:hypothetical protein